MLNHQLAVACFMIRFALACLILSLFLLPGRVTTAAAAPAWQSLSPARLLITEFYYNPPGLDEEREWVELANVGGESLSITAYGLGDEEQPGGGEAMLRFPDGSEIGAGEAIVVAQTAAGFRALYGTSPDYEITSTDTAVPDMIAGDPWATGRFALANRGDEIILVDDQNNIIDTLSYGDRTTFFAPSLPEVVSGQSVERMPAHCDTDSAADWRPQMFPNPGQISLDGNCLSAPEQDEGSAPQLRRIGDIQGSGDSSPLLNQVVTFQGVVTGNMEDQNAAGVLFHTIFVQDAPGLEDGDPATSDAIAVFLGRRPPHYAVGDEIRVTGQVTEYYGLTEIDDRDLSIQLNAASQLLPDAQVIDLPQEPAAASAYLEAHEGMLVRTGGPLPVFGPTHAGCGFAVAATAGASRPIRHDAGEKFALPIMVINRSDVDCSALPALGTGDLVAGIAGPLTYHFEQYKVVQQTSDLLDVQRAPPPTPGKSSIASADRFRVATLNLDNYLIPSSDQEALSSERPTGAEIEIKKRKLAHVISRILGCPELLGVQEVESKELLLALAAQTADSCGFTYRVTHRDSADARGIDVALLSDPRRVSVGAAELHQTCSPLATGIIDSGIRCPSAEEPLFSRPPLEVAVQLDGESLILLVNHFKSKRGGEVETAPRRLAQADHVHDLVQDRLANQPQAGIILLGDFNDNNRSPVWQKLQEGGVLYDATQRAPSQERYSYIFDGVGQLVDGILVSPALVHRIERAEILHINADYPVSLAHDDSPAALPFHASDHDPVLLTINSASLTVPTVTAATASRRTPSPTSTLRMPGQPAAVTVTATVVTADHPPPESEQNVPAKTSVSFQQRIAAGMVVLLAAAAVLLLLRRH